MNEKLRSEKNALISQHIAVHFGHHLHLAISSLSIIRQNTMPKLRLLVLFGWLGVAIYSAVAQMTELDRENWHKAVKVYFDLYPKKQVRSYRTNLGSYETIKSLELLALVHAHSTGVIPISKYALKPASVENAPTKSLVYFTSVIKPGDMLHDKMSLQGKTAFAFWKHQGHQFRLLHIDTLDAAHVTWPIQSLGEVLRG